ncbi:Protein prenyltransferase alpha subunit repeat [Popillia japonica]|uniref:Geranylgeranyl transferase type-2 subunit alpha n=1 Tax=Popillia japonica TaxID=7064 RepID=A0AAW1HFY2_POPJA
MHGRLKVRSTEEQKLLKQKEQQKKLRAYKYAMNQVAATRKEIPFNKDSLMLCAQVLSVNPDVYTLWNYRKEVVLQQLEMSKDEEVDDALVSFLENEIKLTEQCLLDNPKSYSSWHHRYWILQRHPKPNWQQEFSLITKYLTFDDRNFHCWDYRRLIINKIGISLCNELNFSTERLNINFSNYSSWHYRSTLRKLDSECLEEELELVQNAVFTDPNDSSAWFYLRWILSDRNVTNEKREELLESLTQLLDMDPDCKWILMAKCWLTGSLSLTDNHFAEKRIMDYKKLKELDPLRKGQYSDYLECAKKAIGTEK